MSVRRPNRDCAGLVLQDPAPSPDVRVCRFRKPPRTFAVGVAAALALICGSVALPGAAAAAPVNTAPTLTVTNGKVSWSAQAGAKDFKAAISTGARGSATRTSTYQDLGVVSSFSPTPPPAGQTLYYGVASEGPGGEDWSSNEVAITTPGPVSSPAPVGPASPPASGSGAFRVAVMGTTNHEYIPGLMSKVLGAGVNWDRIDVGNGSDLSEVQNALSQGMKSLVLYNPGLAGMAPATAAAQVKALAQKLLPLGLTEIEFGNEVYYNGSTPQTYAAQYAAAHAALAGMGITLIANAWGDYEQSNGSWSQMAAGNGWIHDFMAASPGPVDAWSVHPYGPMGQITDGNDSGEGMIPAFRAAAIANGSSAPWYVTEVGQNMGGDVYSPAVTQTQQATDLTTYLNDVQTKYPYVKMLTWYEVVDDSSGQWGLVNNDASSRPSFTALAQWMGTHTSTTNG
jgi:hypothetical protein